MQAIDIFPEISKVRYYWLQDANANDIAVIIEVVVESCSMVPAIHPDLVATRDTGHCAVGRFAVRANKGSE